MTPEQWREIRDKLRNVLECECQFFFLKRIFVFPIHPDSRRPPETPASR
jgi:hypothetical protein